MKKERYRDASELPKEVRNYIYSAYSLGIWLLMGIGSPFMLFGVIACIMQHDGLRFANLAFTIGGGMFFLLGVLLLIAVRGAHYTWRAGWITGCTTEENRDQDGAVSTSHYIYIDGIKCSAISTQDYVEALNRGGRGILIRFHFFLPGDYAIASEAAMRYM